MIIYLQDMHKAQSIIVNYKILKADKEFSEFIIDPIDMLISIFNIHGWIN